MIAHETAVDLHDIDSKRIYMLEEVPERDGDGISLCVRVYVPVHTHGEEPAANLHNICSNQASMLAKLLDPVHNLSCKP